jgi:hypothetical protein
VNGFRQHDLRQHAAAPRLMRTLQVLDNVTGRSLFQTTDNARRAMSVARPDQQVKMFRHQDVADEPEVKLMPQLV